MGVTKGKDISLVEFQPYMPDDLLVVAKPDIVFVSLFHVDDVQINQDYAVAVHTTSLIANLMSAWWFLCIHFWVASRVVKSAPFASMRHDCT